MSNYRLHSWGSVSYVASGSAWNDPSFHSLDNFNPKADFWIEVLFDIDLVGQDTPLPSYYFLVCNNQGLANYINSNFFREEQEMTLKNVVLMHEYSYQRVVSYLQTEVSSKCIQLTDKELFLYLGSRFDVEED